MKLAKYLISALFSFVVLQSAAQETTSVHGDAFRKYWAIVQKSPAVLDALPAAQIGQLYQALLQHPVVSTSQLGKYDPTGAIGFCFGRDMAAFLLARRAGLKVEAMRSLFIIGDLRSGADPEWRFHVTKIVKTTDGTWWALDPIVPQGKALPVATWIQTVRGIWDKRGIAKLYVTSPFQVLPDVRRMPMPDQERGLTIIELKFDPRGKPGIVTSNLLASSGVQGPIYELSAQAGVQYFLSTNEPAADVFPMDSLTINDAHFDFNGFLLDLMNHTIGGNSAVLRARREFAPQAFNLEASVSRQRSNGGFRFDRSFYQSQKGHRR